VIVPWGLICRKKFYT